LGNFVGGLGWQVWLDGEEVGECASLLLGELAAEAVRVEDGLTLGKRHLADITEGASYQAATVRRRADR